MNSACPIDHSPLQSGLNGDEELIFPLHKRCIVQYSENAEGIKELHIYYDDKEISFEEPELFAFGEALAKQGRFIARSSTEWGDGYDWLQLKPLLEELLQQDVLQHAQHTPEDATTRNAICPSPLPPAQTSVARNWWDCTNISQELTGRKLELGHLELVIPVFRVAHIALDAEGRQVGEANVFPASLRLDVKTEWRTCPYSGSRYLDERPMNVTALRSMSTYWSQMMGALLQIHQAYLQRYPEAAHGWTVGGIEALSTLVLAVPTYQLMRSQNPVENGDLHPALASMFRVTDGLRMVTHQMIFVPVSEPTLPTSTPMTTREIYDYSERNYAFSSAHGVCAGPKVMVEEFLDVLVNGNPIDNDSSTELDVAVQAALADLPVAFDYGLYGLQAHAVMFSLWPAMTRCYVQLHKIAQSWTVNHTPAMQQWQQRLTQHIAILNSQTHHASEEWRQNREQAYADIYRHCAQGLNPNSQDSLEQALINASHEPQEALKSKLQALLLDFCGGDRRESAVLLNCLLEFLHKAQAIVGLACQIQSRINQLLDRPDPEQPFELSQIDIHNLLQGVDNRRLPFILDELNEQLNIRILVTADTIDIQ